MNSLCRKASVGLIAFAVSFAASTTAYATSGQGNARNPAPACEQLGALKLKDVNSITAQPVTVGSLPDRPATEVEEPETAAFIRAVARCQAGRASRREA